MHLVNLTGGELGPPRCAPHVPEQIPGVFLVRIPAFGLDQRAEVSDHPGREARSFDRPRSLLGRGLRDVAGREVRQIRAAERCLRQDIRRVVLPGEAG
jgi:hypothetical protein